MTKKSIANKVVIGGTAGALVAGISGQEAYSQKVNEGVSFGVKNVGTKSYAQKLTIAHGTPYLFTETDSTNDLRVEANPYIFEKQGKKAVYEPVELTNVDRVYLKKEGPFGIEGKTEEFSFEHFMDDKNPMGDNVNTEATDYSNNFYTMALPTGDTTYFFFNANNKDALKNGKELNFLTVVGNGVKSDENGQLYVDGNSAKFYKWVLNEEKSNASVVKDSANSVLNPSYPDKYLSQIGDTTTGEVDTVLYSGPTPEPKKTRKGFKMPSLEGSVGGNFNQNVDGSNNFSGEGFIGVGIGNTMFLGPYFNYNGNGATETSNTEITEEVTKPITPTLNKTKQSEVTTTINTQRPYELGLKFVAKLNDNVNVFTNIGAEKVNTAINKDGTKNLYFFNADGTPSEQSFTDNEGNTRTGSEFTLENYNVQSFENKFAPALTLGLERKLFDCGALSGYANAALKYTDLSDEDVKKNLAAQIGLRLNFGKK